MLIKDKTADIGKKWDFADIAQGLIAVNFSLWRAVFLTDIDAKMENTIRDAQAFLGNLILHNTVAYSQDRSTRDWTFLYYVNSARIRLENIAATNNELLPPSLVAGGAAAHDAKDYWSFYQNAFEMALKNFATVLS